jgi:hypothetical protein
MRIWVFKEVGTQMPRRPKVVLRVKPEGKPTSPEVTDQMGRLAANGMILAEFGRVADDLFMGRAKLTQEQADQLSARRRDRMTTPQATEAPAPGLPAPDEAFDVVKATVARAEEAEAVEIEFLPKGAEAVPVRRELTAPDFVALDLVELQFANSRPFEHELTTGGLRWRIKGGYVWHYLAYIKKSERVGESNKSDYTDIVENTAARFHALADDALKKGLSIAEFEEAIEDKLTAKAQAAARETTGRATVEPHLSAPVPQSHKEKLAAAKKLITGGLPPLFARQRARRKPGKPSIADEARRIASRYERDNGKVNYDESAMTFVRAAYVVLASHKMKSQASMARAVRSTERKNRAREFPPNSP